MDQTGLARSYLAHAHITILNTSINRRGLPKIRGYVILLTRRKLETFEDRNRVYIHRRNHLPRTEDDPTTNTLQNVPEVI